MKPCNVTLALLTAALSLSAAPTAAPSPTTAPSAASSAAPTLIFRTTFDGQRVEPSRGSDDRLVGTDSAHAPDSDPAVLREKWGVGEFGLQYTGGEPTQRFAKLEPDPLNPANQVLHFQIKEGYAASENQIKCRVQANLYGFKQGLPEFYQSVRVFVPDHMAELKKFPKAIHWLTISEFWNNTWWGGNKNGFRVTLGMGKPAGEHDLNFILNAEDPGQKEVWKGVNLDVKVPIGKWFTMDYYFKEGDETTGRFYLAITPDGGQRLVVHDVHNWTHNTTDPSPDGIDSWNPLKLYTSAELAAFMKSRGKTLDLYWDDLTVWTNKQP